MLSGLKFPFQFDPVRLRADLAKVRPEDWAPHYNERDYGGDWRGAALRSGTGSTTFLAAAPAGQKGFIDTPLMARCAYYRDVVSVFQCPLKSVRLLSLAPQSFIREHSDNALAYEDGEIRIHVPVQTSSEAEFYVAGERLLLAEGQCYYVNVNLPHRVNNRGTAERIHLVIDAEVNGWVCELVQRGREEGWKIPRSAAPARGFEAFRRIVLTDPALQTRLQRAASRAELIETAIQLGRERNFDFNEADAAASCRLPAPAAPVSALSKGWLPTQVNFHNASFHNPSATAEWTWFGDRRLTEPFFGDSVRACLRNPFAAMFRRELPLDAAAENDSVAPCGFIYHMTRCGSTLIAQMLGALPGTIVVSEAPPIDEVLQARRSMPEIAHETQVQWLRWVVAALGQRRTGNESRYFVKLDAWNIHNLPLIRAAFPDTPWIFVFRDPVEVMASQLESPGKPALPGAIEPAVLGLEPQDITGLSREEWCAGMLANVCRAALAQQSCESGMFVNYRQLPDIVWGEIAAHFKISFDEKELALLCAAARFDAKYPGSTFQPDEAQKQLEGKYVLERDYGPVLSDLYISLLAASA
jgi:hypothetical protein